MVIVHSLKTRMINIFIKNNGHCVPCSQFLLTVNLSSSSLPFTIYFGGRGRLCGYATCPSPHRLALFPWGSVGRAAEFPQRWGPVIGVRDVPNLLDKGLPVPKYLWQSLLQSQKLAYVCDSLWFSKDNPLLTWHIDGNIVWIFICTSKHLFNGGFVPLCPTLEKYLAKSMYKTRPLSGLLLQELPPLCLKSSVCTWVCG